MATDTEPDKASHGVHAELEYVSLHSMHNLRYVGGGQEVNTGEFDRHRVFIRDARAAKEPLTLETGGFTLARRSTQVDLYDTVGAESAYAREIEPLLVELTGADKVVLFGPRRRHTLRSDGEALPGATDVHVDYGAEDSRRLAQRLLGPPGDKDVPYRRFMAINIWRPLSPPPQNRPLAICDARSVVTQSGVPNTLMLVDRMPPREEMLAEAPNDPAARRGFLFHFDPAHRWFYYPMMTPEEVILFKLYDSIEAGPWRCPHTSFIDPSAADAPPRESYEIRSFVYFR